MPAIAAICLFAQPLFFAHSFSELTEIPFALAGPHHPREPQDLNLFIRGNAARKGPGEEFAG
jgi:hypothetical protein